MYTLENSRCDCIIKENGKWHFNRTLPQAEFTTYEEALAAVSEIEAQGLYVSDIKIENW